MKTSETLNKAANLIQERGWTKGNLGWRSDGPLCLEGAIGAAAGVDTSESVGTVEINLCPAGRALRDYLSLQHYDDLVAYCAIESVSVRQPLWSWNDKRAGSADHIVEVLRAAALIESAREDQDAAFATYAQNVAVA